MHRTFAIAVFIALVLQPSLSQPCLAGTDIDMLRAVPTSNF
jgi:hypothetical protein